MSFVQPSPFLRRVLALDALSSGALGLALAVGAGPLSDLLALPESALRSAGVLLLPFAAFVGWLSAQPRIRPALVWAVVALNAFWAIDSGLALALGWVAPNLLGYVFVIGQAVVVAVLAELEAVGIRRAGLAAAV